MRPPPPIPSAPRSVRPGIASSILNRFRRLRAAVGRAPGLGPIAALLILPALSTHAAPVPVGPAFDGQVIVSSDAGVPLVYAVEGDRLGLVGLRWADVGDVLSRDVFDSFTGSTIRGIYAGPGLSALDAALAEFDDISGGYALPATQRTGDGRIWSAVWVRWEGSGNLVLRSFRSNGRTATATLQGATTRAGDPLSAEVPLPMPIWLLLTGIAALAGAGRLRRRATCGTCPG